MGFASQETQQKFPFEYEKVFTGLLEVIPYLDYTLKSQDKVIGRITCSAGISLFSWGENITLIVERINDKSTLVSIESSLKLGANFYGAHRHQKNFDKIIQTLSEYLQGKLEIEYETEGETFECSDCNTVVPADAKYCPNCGVKFK